MDFWLRTTAYFPSVEILSLHFGCRPVSVEAHESYGKQSYRNRCTILGSSGKLSLSVPVVKGTSSGRSIREVKIDYSEAWQRDHLRTLRTAYQSAPFGEDYLAWLLPFFERKEQFLFDLNEKITLTLLDLLGNRNTPLYSWKFSPMSRDNPYDLRGRAESKSGFSPVVSFPKYRQNFSIEEQDFVGGLSCLDLLFNMGPASQLLLADYADQVDKAML